MIHLSMLDQMGYVPVSADGKGDWLTALSQVINKDIFNTYT